MRIAAVLLSMLAVTAACAAGSFPVGDLFRPLVADPAEPRSFVSVLKLDTPVDRFTVASVGYGTNFGLRRWPGEQPGEGWQTGIFGAVFSQFNLSESSDELINSDFVVGVPLTFKRGAVSARARFWHQSSHLGDELILGGRAPPRIDLSIEVLDGLLAWEHGAWRAYGGGYYVVRHSAEMKRTGVHAGIDYAGRSAILAGGRLVVGLDVKWFDETDWHSGVSGKIGVEFGRPAPARRGLTLLLEAYDGFSPFGQFARNQVSYYGAGLQFDF